MNDTSITIADLKKIVDQFIAERDWRQFHTPKNMSMALAAEAGELLEHFLWATDADPHEPFEKRREAIEDEVADIATCLLAFCAENKIDLAQSLERKMIKNREKYPLEKARGIKKKYNH